MQKTVSESLEAMGEGLPPPLPLPLPPLLLPPPPPLPLALLWGLPCWASARAPRLALSSSSSPARVRRRKGVSTLKRCPM